MVGRAAYSGGERGGDVTQRTTFLSSAPLVPRPPRISTRGTRHTGSLGHSLASAPPMRHRSRHGPPDGGGLAGEQGSRSRSRSNEREGGWRKRHTEREREREDTSSVRSLDGVEQTGGNERTELVPKTHHGHLSLSLSLYVLYFLWGSQAGTWGPPVPTSLLLLVVGAVVPCPLAGVSF